MASFSLIIPVQKIPIPLIASTLESIHLQKNIQHEVFLIEAHNCLEIQEVIDRFEADHIKSIQCDNDRLDALIQKGIDAASGDYINILRPGEYYISNYALETVSEFIEEHDEPELIACARIERFEKKQTLKFDLFDQKSLSRGYHPTTLEHLWIKKTIFEKTGSYDASYAYHGRFDFLARRADKNIEPVQFRRVLTDSHRLKVELKNPLQEGREMIQILTKRFGPLCAIKWWFTQNQVNFFQGLFKVLKKAFFARA